MKLPETSNLVTKILVVLVTAILMVYFYPHHRSDRFNYEEGKPWAYAKLIAPFDIPKRPDSVTVERLRDSLDRHFVPIYSMNENLVDTINSRLPKSPGTNHRDKLAAALRKVYSKGVVDMRTKAKIDSGILPKVRILEGNVLSEISTAALSSPRDAYMYVDSIMRDPDLHRYFAAANLQNLLLPNFTVDEIENSRNYQYDFITLTAGRGVIVQGEAIVDKAQRVTPEIYTYLKTYEEMLADRDTSDRASRILQILGQFLYVALLLSGVTLYLFFFAPEIYNNFRAFFFIYVLLATFFIVAMGLNYWETGGIYIAPMMIVPILLLVFFDGTTAMIVSFVLSLVCAGVTPSALEYVYLQFCATCAAVYSLRELSRRAQLLRTSFFVAAAYLCAYVAVETMMNGSVDSLSWRMVAMLAVNSALTSMAYIIMSAVERAFGFISVVTLVELADINNPLLSRLSNECPGTFQHSIAVSNLASDAASRIDANVQLVRAGALYHDIGKLTNPAFFTENQHGVNPHDALPPERSAAIVTAHVPDGIKLAQKAGLPLVIQDFIKEHHGAGMAKYFYITWCRNHPGEEPDKALFSYPGPNPRSRETSVLMMADAVEAASRSLQEHTREAITDLVNKIIDGQIADGLHNQSTLTFSDVAKIKEAFIKRLMTIYHSRIAYPKSPAPASN